MINEYTKHDLDSYKKTTLWSAATLFLVILMALGLAWFLQLTTLIPPLLGGLLGSLLATINLFALGYAFYALAIKKMPKKAIFWPFGTFFILLAVSLLLALYGTDYIIGFALGLTTPLIFGAVIVFGSSHPK